MICGHCKADGIRSVEAMKAHWSEVCQGRAEWKRVAELRRAGSIEEADRLARRLLGIKGEPMPEDVKEKLRKYQEEHKDEIAVRRALKANERRLSRRGLQGSRRLVRAR